MDIPDIKIVIQYGITRDVPTTLQRGGRGGRNTVSDALFLIMYEPWVKVIALGDVSVQASLDPDHPNVTTLTIRSTKRERTGIAMITLIQKKEACIRKMIIDYLADRSLRGESIIY